MLVVIKSSLYKSIYPAPICKKQTSSQRTVLEIDDNEKKNRVDVKINKNVCYIQRT